MSIDDSRCYLPVVCLPTFNAQAQVWMLRDRLLKLGAQVAVFVRRIVLHLPHSFPYGDSFQRLAFSLGVRGG